MTSRKGKKRKEMPRGQKKRNTWKECFSYTVHYENTVFNYYDKFIKWISSVF